MSASPAHRRLIGSLLVGSAAVLVAVAAAFWWGWLSVGAEARPMVAGALVIAAAADVLLALRFLGE